MTASGSADADAAADAARDTTVRCCLKKAMAPGLGSSAADPNDVLGIIDDAVLHTSRIAARGAQVVLLTVLKTLDTHEGRLPDDFFGTGVDTFFDQCFKVGLPPAGEPPAAGTENGDTPRATVNQYVKATYSDERVEAALANQTIRRKVGDSNLLVYASQSYQTNFLNFFDCELDRRILTFVKGVWRWKFPAKKNGLPKGARYRCFRVASEPWNDRVSIPDGVPEDVKDKVLLVPGITEADVELVFDPPWSREMMSEAAQLQVGFM